jgi:hypothetical protein
MKPADTFEALKGNIKTFDFKQIIIQKEQELSRLMQPCIRIHELEAFKQGLSANSRDNFELGRYYWPLKSMMTFPDGQRQKIVRQMEVIADQLNKLKQFVEMIVITTYEDYDNIHDYYEIDPIVVRRIQNASK